MKNLMNIVRMYFQEVSSFNIIRGQLDYREFNKEDFEALALQELTHFSESESEELYNFLKNRVGKTEKENGLNVFRALKETVRQYLLVRENQPVCDYDKLLEWRELTKNIGEDFCVCAFLADRTERSGYVWDDFEWGMVIAHDNVQLNCIMQRGISDNHFHLFGSAPVFKLVWIRLMNQVDNYKFIAGLREMDKKKRQTRKKYSIEYQEDVFEKMYFQAALIRLVLFYYIDMAKQGRGRDADTKLREMRGKIQQNLIGEEYLFNRAILQCYIDELGMMSTLLQNDMTGDYANKGYFPRSINHEFEGERAMMYQMLLGKINGEAIPAYLLNWFYAYVVIQIKFREELVQVNNTIGFENFSQYSRRKSLFLFTPRDDKKMVQHAVMSTFETGNIKNLEVRIKPCDTAGANAVWINRLDSYMKEKMDENKLKHVYYVLHFAKQKDKDVSFQSGVLPECRHGAFRRKLEKQAAELVRFREEYPEEASRVLGIDACAKEIGCRPEVFATIYRQLANHVTSNPLCLNVKQWRRTYHVGEDWLDIVDGLRAIDEALLFLEMGKGDRLGHATVLGIDVRAWYKKKRNSIRLPLHDYLDNVVWFYHKLIDFNIPNCETLKGHLLREYDRCFKKTYSKEILKKTAYYGIDVYYEAWKLRGDSPELYYEGEYNKQYQYLLPHWINEAVSNGEEIRNSPAAIDLLYNYHYRAELRSASNMSEEVDIPDFYIDGVEQIQRMMQRYIAQKGIFVEANPSSNLLISTMDKYEDHPITNLYNLGLTWDSKELRKCPQIHVSINTDDKGVFHTSLENEYALMGCALEQMQDKHGGQKYQKQMVYEWMERIRENGIQQSFLQLKENWDGTDRKDNTL